MARKINLLFSQEVVDYLDHLLNILYEQQYFGYKSSTKAYVTKIYDFIDNSITTFPFKKTPEKLKHFGQNYIFYNSNDRTTWYIFFEKKGNDYIITGILNNHCKESRFL
jgi:hypothetical protein